MDELFIAIVAPTDVLQDLKHMRTPAEIELSDPVPYDSLSDALDSPLGSEEIKQILELLEVGFKTAASILVFAKALIELIKQKDIPYVTVLEGRTGRKVTKVTRDSDPAAIAARLRGPLP